MSLFCNKCGTENVDAASFCKACGNNLAEQKRQTEELKKKAQAEAEAERARKERADRERAKEEVERERVEQEERARQDSSMLEMTTEQRFEKRYERNTQASTGNDSIIVGVLIISAILFVISFLIIPTYKIYTIDNIRNLQTTTKNTVEANATETNATETNATETNGAQSQINQAIEQLNKADKLWDQKKWKFSNVDLAMQYLNLSIQLHPTANAYNLRALAYENNLNKPKKAIADYTEAIRLQPNDKVLHNNRGWAYYNMGDIKNAAKDAKITCELGDCKLLEYLKNNK